MKANAPYSLFLVFGTFLLIVPHVFFQFFQEDSKYNHANTFLVDAADFFYQFEQNEQKANEVYLDQIIQVKGEIKEIQKLENGKTIVVLKTGSPIGEVRSILNRNSQEAIAQFRPNTEITLQGKCLGMLMDVILDETEVVKPKP